MSILGHFGTWKYYHTNIKPRGVIKNSENEMFQTIVLITATAATVLQFYTLVRPNWSKEAKASSEVSHLGKSYGGLWYRCYTRKYKGDFSCDNYTSPFFTLEGLLFMRILYTWVGARPGVWRFFGRPTKIGRPTDVGRPLTDVLDNF